MFEIKPINKPKWYEPRKQLARFFIWCAKKVEKDNDYYKAYLMEKLIKAHSDRILYGSSEIEIEAE